MPAKRRNNKRESRQEQQASPAVRSGSCETISPSPRTNSNENLKPFLEEEPLYAVTVPKADAEADAKADSEEGAGADVDVSSLQYRKGLLKFPRTIQDTNDGLLKKRLVAVPVEIVTLM